MATGGDVHWHEGLFLRPHHLQSMQRGMLEKVRHERRLAWNYPYGVVRARLSPDALENMLVRFDQLQVVMPGGLEVNVPENADLPALNIEEAFAGSGGGLTIYLGVPLWYEGRANVIEEEGEEQWRVKRLYRLEETQRPDENTGQNAQPVVMRRVNARLLLESDDQSDMEVIPLLRVRHGTGEDVGLPREDPGFAPPCLVLRGSRRLHGVARDLADQVDASRKELVNKMSPETLTREEVRGTQLRLLLRLRTLHRYAARLTSLMEAPAVTPFELYVELKALLGELASLTPGAGDQVAEPYDHDNPLVSLQDLSNKIRALLKGAVGEKFLSVPFRREEEFWVADLEQRHLTEPNAYYLGVRSKEDPATVIQLVQDASKFKLMPKSLGDRAVFGFKLVEEHYTPLELPSPPGLTYFRVDQPRERELWEIVEEDMALAVRWPGMASSDFDVTLYMTLTETGG